MTIKPSDCKLKPYKWHEYREMDKLTSMCSSSNQMERIKGRLRMQVFETKHGRAKCEAIFTDIMRADERKRSGK